MASERYWAPYGPYNLLSNGDDNGYISVPTTFGLYVKMKVTLVSNTQAAIQLEVKEVVSSSIVRLGPPNQPLDKFSKLSQFLTADSAKLSASRQAMNVIDPKDIENATYAREPIVARRVIGVDRHGNYYSVDNPLPVQLSNGSINIGTVNAELEVQLSHRDNFPDPGDVADSVRIGDGDDELEINDDGSINTVPGLPVGASLKSIYDEVSSIVNSVSTDVLIYTVPVGTTSKLIRIDTSGNNIATYSIEVNNVVIDKKYTWFNGDLSQEFVFDKSITLAAGDVLKVKVIHTRPNVGDFNARLTVQEQV